MHIKAREELIDRYYDAVDAESYERMLSAFSETVEYRYPGEAIMNGHAEVLEFFTERRATNGTTHDVFRQVHDEDATLCEGTITGKIGDAPLEGAFVGVFEFDTKTELIAAVAVYTRL